MIFVGDIALPSCVSPEIDYVPWSDSEIVVANLEGAIVDDGMASLTERKVFSNNNVVSFLQSMNVKLVSLANNHITDMPQAFMHTKQQLDSSGIMYCGAGIDYSEATKECVLKDNGEEYVFLAFGWKVISCKYVGKERSLGVNPLEPEHVINCVKRARERFKDANLIILMHWNYESEINPHPMHRELARAVIDIGADAIIGHHPHCVNDIEYYRDKPIVYSLGNWFFPHNIYMNGRLAFPDYSNEQYAFQLRKEGDVLHKFQYDASNNNLFYRESIDARELAERDFARMRTLSND